MELKNFNLRLLVAGIKKYSLYLCNQPCQTPDFVLISLFGRFIKIFNIEDHVVCKVSPLPFQYVCLNFFITLLLFTVSRVQWCIDVVRMDILSLFLI